MIKWYLGIMGILYYLYESILLFFFNLIQDMFSKVRVLTLSFNVPIEPFQISLFRKEIIKKVEFHSSDLFHNHKVSGGFFNRYPLIQYKIIKSRDKLLPSLLCFNKGVEQIHNLLSQPNWSINLAGKKINLEIKKLKLVEHQLHFRETPIVYNLSNWQALNKDNYKKWRAIEECEEEIKIKFLEKILTSQLLVCARGLNWELQQRLNIHIRKIYHSKWVSFKGVKINTFSIRFSTYISLPEFIGIGKGTSLGFGVIERCKRREKY